ncbi:hypothetical protein KSP39_PZI023719 [Platanthera zijinensis]|uniref:Uncharacterized protein n=1 Tax=Platanthera zijinensis TaxID=2320716 RepID=A0AAP0ATH2_9ASPA
MASTLNPRAAPFVPFFYREVDDFSAEWWRLVKSSPWFRDFWLRERFNEEKLEGLVFIDPDHAGEFLLQALLLFSDLPYSLRRSRRLRFVMVSEKRDQKEKKRINERMELMAWGAEKWMEARCRPSDVRRCSEKAHKFVSPREIGGYVRLFDEVDAELMSEEHEEELYEYDEDVNPIQNTTDMEKFVGIDALAEAISSIATGMDKSFLGRCTFAADTSITHA